MRDFLTRNRVPFVYDESDGPVEVAVGDGRTLHDPDLITLADAVGCHVRPNFDSYDLVVVGAGPAGLAAAVYGAAEGLRTLAIERFAPGGQAGTSSLIENYPGFPDGVSGNELADRTHRQATRLGAEILLPHEVVGGGLDDDERHTLVLGDGTSIAADAVVCSTGVDWRRLDVDGLDDLLGRGVYYGAATSEAPGIDDEDITIVGGGNSAGQAALFFARWARSVTMLVRGDGLASTLSSYLLVRIEADDAITVRPRTQIVAVTGDDWLDTITLVDNTDGSTSTERTHALFVCVGGVPRTRWAVEAGIVCDDGGYLVTGPDLADATPTSWTLDRRPDVLETSRPGLYATGDVRHGTTKRIATAMGEGALVVKVVGDRLAATGR